MPSPSSKRKTPTSRSSGCIRLNCTHQVPGPVAAGTPPDTAFVGSGEYRTYIKESSTARHHRLSGADPLVGAPTILLSRKNVTDARKTGAGMASAHAGWHRTFIIKPKPLRQPAWSPQHEPRRGMDVGAIPGDGAAMTVDVNGNHPGDAGFDVNNVDRWGVHWPTLSGSTQLHSAIVSNGGTGSTRDWSDRARQAGGHAGAAKHRRPDAGAPGDAYVHSPRKPGHDQHADARNRQAGPGHRGILGAGLDEEH